MKWRWLVLIVSLLLCFCVPACGEVQLRAEAGYNGVVIDGQWVPVCVEILADAQTVDGVISVDVYQDVDVYDRIEMPVHVPAGEKKSVRFCVFPQIRQRSFSFVLRNGETEIASESTSWQHSISEDALVIGMLGVDQALAAAIRSSELRNAHGWLETIGLLVLDADSMMRTECEIGALDALIIGDFDLNKLDEQQKELIEQWEKNGGVCLYTEKQHSAMDEAGDPPDAHAQAAELLSAIAEELASGKRSGGGYANYTFGSGLMQSMRVGEGRSILPAGLLLIAYAVLIGAGLYLFFARRDRGWLLWAVIPASALLCMALVALLGRTIRIADPTAAQLHITVIDEQGNSWTEESASLSYAGQERAEITTETGVPVERRAYAYFNAYSEWQGQDAELRDRLTLGETPGIELAEGAVWLTRSLMIGSHNKIEGKIDAQAWMAEDGLHAQIDNLSDTALKNAWLLTEVGYTFLGDILPGEGTHALLTRADVVRKDKNGEDLIPPDTAIPYSAGIYQSIRVLVDPEYLVDEDFNIGKLSKDEQYARGILSSKLGLSNQVRQDEFACVIVADTPEIACAPLLMDGIPVDKSSGLSVMIMQVPFSRISPDGYCYYPQGTVKAHIAMIDDEGMPRMGEKEAESYYDREQLPDCFGFRIEGIDVMEIEQIRVTAQRYHRDEEPALEVYDVIKKRWIPLEGGLRPILEGELLACALSETGELFLRYGDMQNESAYYPEIIVEGRASR